MPSTNSAPTATAEWVTLLTDEIEEPTLADLARDPISTMEAAYGLTVRTATRTCG